MEAKPRRLRNEVATAKSQRESAERQRQTAEKNIKNRETKAANEVAKIAENENRIASAEAELVKTQTENRICKASCKRTNRRLRNCRNTCKRSTKRREPKSRRAFDSRATSPADDARKQLESAEHEKTLIAEKLGPMREQSRGPEVMVQRREPSFHPSIRGTVLAVNQGLHFVVLQSRQSPGAGAECRNVSATRHHHHRKNSHFLG